MLDMSDIVSDPDFADTFDVIRTSVVTSNDGRGHPVEVPMPGIIGTVTQGPGDELVRERDGERIRGDIMIHTTFRLQDGEAGKTADIVVWPAGSQERYTVTLTSDYSRLGGFVAAACTRLNYIPEAE